MTLTYKVEEKDLLSWYRYSVKKSPLWVAARKRYIAFWGAVFIGLASAAVLAFQTYPAAVVGYGLAAVLTFSTWKAYDVRTDNALKAFAWDPLVKGSFGPAELTISELGLREVTPAADASLKWQSVIDAVRDGDYVFVRLSTGQAAVISRRSFAGPVPFEDIPKVITDFKQNGGSPG